MDSKIRTQTIEFLRGLNDEDLAELFYEAMAFRNRYRHHEDGDFWNEVYVIGIAYHAKGEAAELLALATAHESSDSLSEEDKISGPLQEGQCDICKTLVKATTKIAKCPVCGAEVGCT